MEFTGIKWKRSRLRTAEKNISLGIKCLWQFEMWNDTWIHQSSGAGKQGEEICLSSKEGSSSLDLSGTKIRLSRVGDRSHREELTRTNPPRAISGANQGIFHTFSQQQLLPCEIFRTSVCLPFFLFLKSINVFNYSHPIPVPPLYFACCEASNCYFIGLQIKRKHTQNKHRDYSIVQGSWDLSGNNDNIGLLG